ncbi:MAG TPA: hypothetical protein VN861_03395 [Candidatus Acidoferrales bacterium]|nr:hypothetical protein [Candidatus Acidoferrales bacterium]
MITNYYDLVQSILPAWNGRLAGHHIGYLADGHVHRAVPYNAADLKVMAKRLSLMRAAGFDMLIETWQGPWATACHADAIANSALCTEMGMQFALLLDPGGMQKWLPNQSQATITANVVAALESAAPMIAASSYVPEKFILDFNTGANLSTLAKAFPSYNFLAQGSGFSWISIPKLNSKAYLSPDDLSCNSLSVANLKSQHSNPAMKVASFCFEFDDSGMPLPSGVQSMATFLAAGGNRDFTQSCWGGPARRLYSYSGQFARQQIATINPSTPIIAAVTITDYDENTALEPKLAEAAGVNWSTL